MKKLISFDLQGTLSDSAFSDEFWLELLPRLYSEKHAITIVEAKDILENQFKVIGKYHELFYNHRLRLDELLPTWNFADIISMLTEKPYLDNEMLDIVKSIPDNISIILISATTRDFIEIELKSAKHHFEKVFSSIDDFQTPGKPREIYHKIADIMSVNNENCLHIGDCLEMDYQNSRQAGWKSFHFNKNQRLTDLKLALNNFIK